MALLSTLITSSLAGPPGATGPTSQAQATNSISSNTLTLDLNTASVFEVSLNQNINTITINNAKASGNTSSFVLVLVADGTARTVTWPISFKWADGIAPTLTSTNTKKDVFVVFTYDGGTTYYAFTSGQNL